MGPLSHVYVATQVCERHTPLLVLGSVLPDISWGSRIGIGRDKFHGVARQFYDFIKARYPEMIDLGLGVMLHTEENKGADFYSDDRTQGFAVVNAPQLAPQVADLLELETKGVRIPMNFGLGFNSNSWLGKLKSINEQIALVLAHNFVEAGVEYNLITNNPSLVKLYRANLSRVDRAQVVTLLTDYLNLPAGVVEPELANYLSNIGYQDIKLEALVENTVLPLIEGKFGRPIDRDNTARLITQAKSITQADYTDWLDVAIQQMRRDWSWGLV